MDPEPYDDTWPPTGLYYRVQVGGETSGPDAGFREVTGLSLSITTEEVTEGGENRFRHKLPTPAKSENLVLKRGLLVKSAPLHTWCADTLGGGMAEPIKPQAVQVVLLNDQGTPLRTWKIVNAWPVKWEVNGFNAQEAAVLVESIELAYQYFEVSR